MDDVQFVGFWRRVGATAIDVSLLSVLTAPLLYAVYGSGYWLSDALLLGWWDFLLSWVLPAVAIIGLWMWKLATPGKMVFSAVIVDARTGGRPSVGQWIVRYLGYVPAGAALGLGLLWVAFDRRKQGWHDKMAKTVVVRKRGGHIGVRA